MQRFSRYLLPLCYIAALFSVSSIPGDVMEVNSAFRWITPNLQNLLHVPVFGGLALSWLWALGSRFTTERNRFIAAFLLTVMYALVDEGWQSHIPGRYGSFTDLAWMRLVRHSRFGSLPDT